MRLRAAILAATGLARGATGAHRRRARAGAERADVTVTEALTELDEARALVDEAVALYADGDAEAAYTAARNAYLDHFEFVEIPLRVRDEGLTLELEEDFARLRNAIEDGAPVADGPTRSPPRCSDGLDDVERRCRRPASPPRCIAVDLRRSRSCSAKASRRCSWSPRSSAYLEASRNRAYRRPVLLGVGAAVVADDRDVRRSSRVVLDLAPAQRELLEAVTALAAVVVLFYVSLLAARAGSTSGAGWSSSRAGLGGRRDGSALALFGVGFTAVYREGIETALFYQALFGFARGLEAGSCSASLIAAVVLGGVALGDLPGRAAGSRCASSSGSPSSS